MTPLKLEAWRVALSGHPDPVFARYILRSIKGGFSIGFNSNPVVLKCKNANLLSASEQPAVVDKYLEAELKAGRIIEVQASDRNMVHCSPFGVIPKRNRPDKWRLIVDLSAPEGHSVNDGIDKELASLSYVSVDDVVAGIVQYGQGTLLAKMDIRQAYRNISSAGSNTTLTIL